MGSNQKHDSWGMPFSAGEINQANFGVQSDAVTEADLAALKALGFRIPKGATVTRIVPPLASTVHEPVHSITVTVSYGGGRLAMLRIWLLGFWRRLRWRF